MRLVKILSQHQRDFKGEYQCENCNAFEDIRGYDDRYFHDNVIPKMKCDRCGLSTLDTGTPVQLVKTEYTDSTQGAGSQDIFGYKPLNVRTEKEIRDKLIELECTIKDAQNNGESQKVKLLAMYVAGINWCTFNEYNIETLE
jgi:hypothetical protein